MEDNQSWLDDFIGHYVHQPAQDLALTLFTKAQKDGVALDTRVQNEVIRVFITVFTLHLSEQINESLNT